MNRNCYVVYRRAWSIVRHAEVEMRLEYERTWEPGLGLWRDFLLNAEVLESLPAATVSGSGQ
jgi:hypothetical protein